mgnify:CR=1 FL=1
MDLPIDQAIRDGLMKAADPKSLVKRLGASWTILERIERGAFRRALRRRTEISFADRREDAVRRPLPEGPRRRGHQRAAALSLLLPGAHQRKSEPAAKRFQWRTRSSGGAAGV